MPTWLPVVTIWLLIIVITSYSIHYTKLYEIEKHMSHFNLEEALQLIDEVKPRRAFLTHISHLLGRHDDIQHLLPDHVFMAYDGLTLTIH